MKLKVLVKPFLPGRSALMVLGLALTCGLGQSAFGADGGDQSLRTASADVPAQLQQPADSSSSGSPSAASRLAEAPQQVGLKNANIFHPIKMMRPFFFGAVDEVHGFHAELDDLKNSLYTLHEPIIDLGQPIDGLKLKVNNLSDSVSDLHAPLDRMQAPLNGIEKQMVELTKPLDSFQHSLRGIDKDMLELRQPIASMNEPLRALTVSTDKIGTPISKMSGDIESLRAPLSQMVEPLSSVAAPINSLKKPLDSVNDRMQSLGERLTGLEKQLGSFQQSLDNLTKYICFAICGGAAIIGGAILLARPRGDVK